MRYVLFDMGNVLLKFDHLKGSRAVAEITGLDPTQTSAAIFESGLQDRYECGQVSCEEFTQQFCSSTGATINQSDLLRAVSDIFELNVAILPVLTQLKFRGNRMGLLSNTCKAHWDFIRGTGYQLFSTFFSDLFFSFEMKLMKPDREIYDKTLEALNLEPANALFIDDRADNVEGAIAAGIDAIQYQTQSQLIRDLSERQLLN